MSELTEKIENYPTNEPLFVQICLNSRYSLECQVSPQGNDKITEEKDAIKLEYEDGTVFIIPEEDIYQIILADNEQDLENINPYNDIDVCIPQMEEYLEKYPSRKGIKEVLK